MTSWFQTTSVAPGIHMTTEPAVNSMFRANLYTVEGRDADLQVDFGAGVLPIRPALPLSNRPVIALATHVHIDHIGGFHEFDDRWGHAAESEGFATMEDAWTLGNWFRDESLGPSVAEQPYPGFRAAEWNLRPAPLTRVLKEGDVIDLGNRRFTVLHLPGHSMGGIGLLDEFDGTFIAGDAIYDAELIDDIPGASVPDYLATMERLMTLDCRIVFAGHCGAFDETRMRELAQAYIRSKD
ncbi:MAG: MBL fold metallo-hydrolase [Cereibacter sphaeroides]|uniref:MBL fold metallo-hydrolase n=1 Tax=Cereibacter sphaeroides TaxID=1063 RepID=A0A2W5SKJ8_CERSP|nr:MAG: MBL fold metallo-hydrolase [Cereibacter sphaeroides]